MTDRYAIDGLLRSWFAEDAVSTAPPGLATTVAEATRGRRQQPAWLAWLTGDRISTGSASRRRTGALLLAVALLAGTLLALVAGGFLAAGGSPVTPPPSRIYISATPWSFDQPPDVCTAATGTILPGGPLPRVGPPAIEHPRNGMIAGSSMTLVDPATGAVTNTHLPGESSIYGNRWSPDGRWLAIGWGGDPAAGQPPSCRDIYLLASDGTRLANVTGYPSADQAIDVAWSPDGKWLAIARWLDIGAGGGPVGGVAIDALAIGPDGSVVDGRRLWTSDATAVESLGWSSLGVLAWTFDPRDDSGRGLFVLRPGEHEPTSIDLGGVGLNMPRWSADGQELVGLGDGGSADGHVIVVITPSTGTVRSLRLTVPPLGGKYAWDAELFTSSAARIFYPAYSAATGAHDIYSTTLDGTDVHNLTSFPATGADAMSFDAVLSPDEMQVAFLRDDGTWVVDTDGQTPAHGLAGTQGSLSWQPIP